MQNPYKSLRVVFEITANTGSDSGLDVNFDDEVEKLRADMSAEMDADEVDLQAKLVSVEVIPLNVEHVTRMLQLKEPV